ncbi:MAG: cyclic nucleotide-binding domain-containing protein [Xanthomonadales bacterium]|nr:cyclic nucleotide-binding domain-containing protein [Xanthomonadales bacterium]
MFDTVAQSALFWGFISAVSLPLGAAVGMALRPGPRINSAFMAFGAGALLFALSIELLGHVPDLVEHHGLGALFAAIAGALAGGLVFTGANRLLNDRGAFWRSWSNAHEYVARLKLMRSRELVRQLAQVPALEHLPPRLLAELVQRVDVRKFDAADVIFEPGDLSDEIYFIVRGQVVTEGTHGRRELGPGEMFGVRDVLEEQRRSVKARAVEDTTFYALQTEDFEDFLERAPESFRDAIDQERVIESEEELKDLNVAVEEEEIEEEVLRARTAKGAALAIWLGIGIDAVPESLVIGMLAVEAEGMSLALIAGVFMANMPESMASAVTMRRAGVRKRRIFLMWSSLTALTALGALTGALIFPADPVGATFYLVLAIEAMAAGAMLTMIAETMLPEAFEQGGSIVGLTTLIGFLAALSVSVMD